MHRKTTLALALLAGSTGAQCRNLVFPGNIPPSPWTPAGSPYCVVGDVTIGTPLVIQAGTVIEVHGDFSVTMSGALTVSGTATAPVRFLRGPSATSWKGLVLGSGGTVVEHLHVSDASQSGVTITAVGVTLRYAVVVRCRGADGGGIRVVPASGSTGTVFIQDSFVTDNTASSQGGGVYANVFTGASLEIVDTVIARNRTNPTQARGNFNGGGVHLRGTGSATLTRTTVRQNSSLAYCGGSGCNSVSSGGGLYASLTAVTLRQCSFHQNTARAVGAFFTGNGSTALGGGLHLTSGVTSLTIVGSTFACNSAVATNGVTATSRGGAIYTASINASLSHATLYNNTCTGGPSGANLYVVSGTVIGDHCIAFSRTGSTGHGITGTATFDYSDIEGGYAGTGNFSATPGFADANGCDCAALLLGPGAPIVDMGDPQASADDARRPPAHGTARADVGHLGGPANAGWLRPASPFALALIPSQLDRAWGAAPIYTMLDGATPGSPAAVVLTGFDTTPIAPLWVGLFGLVCPTNTSVLELPLPVAPPLLLSLEFTGVTLTNGVLVFSAPKNLTIR